MKLKALMAIVFVFILFLIFSGCTSNNSSNGTDNWLEQYSPVHSVGSGPNHFWIDFPQGNPSSGQLVTHLDWIVDSLKNKPVLFVVHRTGCISCADQAERVISFGEKYEDYISLYDLDAVYDASGDILQKANEVYLYDPNGPPGYIALTGLFTYVKDNGQIKIGWHTWEAPQDMTVNNSELETWIKDAIYYHRINQ